MFTQNNSIWFATHNHSNADQSYEHKNVCLSEIQHHPTLLPLIHQQAAIQLSRRIALENKRLHQQQHQHQQLQALHGVSAAQLGFR